jgi:hypothetical protein
MTQKTLRELAREYARGELNKDAYRQARTLLIAGIQAGTIALRAIDYRPLIRPPEKYAEVAERRGKKGRGRDESDVTAIAIPGKPVAHALPEPDFDIDLMIEESDSAGGMKLALLIAGGVVVALVIGAGIYFTYNSPGKTSSTEESPAVPSSSAAVEPAAAEQPAPDAANP